MGAEVCDSWADDIREQRPFPQSQLKNDENNEVQWIIPTSWQQKEHLATKIVH